MTSSGTYERRASQRAAPPDALIDPLAAITAQLERGCALGLEATVFLRGDPSAGRAVRVIEGTPVGFRATPDGRVRVVLATGTETGQLVLLDRIVRVMLR